MICDDLFKQPATTGLITKESQLWRYEAVNMKLNRDDLPNTGATYAGFDDGVGQGPLGAKESARQFLSPMVGTGKEREQFESLVTKFVAMQQESKDSESVSAWSYYANMNS
jgi:hypothetical protein